MNKLTTLERALLQIVHEGAGQWGWYQLATRLSRMDVPRVPDMLSTLKDMAGRGLVQRHVVPGSPQDRWEVTEKGFAVLKASEADQTLVLAR